MTKPKKTAAFDAVRACCRVLDEKKAEEITVLDVSEQSSITDYLVVATATSEPHLRALRVEIEKVLDGLGTRIVGIEMAQESGWVVMDVFDVMVHLFLGPVREHYGLERLWRDATEVSLVKALAEPAASGSRSSKRSVTKRSSTKKKSSPK